MRGPPIAAAIVEHEVNTVPRMGWVGKRNGQLLSLAAEQFDVFITVDRNLPKQHDIAQCDLAVAILVSSSNRLADLQPLVPALLSTLRNIKPGDTIEVG